MKTSRTLASVGAALLLALLAPLGADARPPQPAGSAAPQASLLSRLPSIAGAHLAISQLTSAPTHVRAGRTYVVRGAIVNEGSAAARGRVVVHLLRVGSRPLAIGGAPVDLAAHDSTGFSVRVRLPRVLRDGSYALVACARRAGQSGALGCVTAERHLQIGSRSATHARAFAGASSAACSSGAHSLSPFGAHVYPETGNGGYTSVHTDVFLNYDTASNLFLPGTHVVLTDQATQCLTDFSLDFERTSPNTKDGPNLTVGSVLVNGQPASFTFVQPTYPGDPNGQNDPDPRAHEAGELNPVGGPDEQSVPARLHAGAADDEPEQAVRPGRHAVPGEQARDHALEPDPERRDLRRPGRLHRPAGRAQRRRRHDGGLVQGRASRATPAAS